MAFKLTEADDYSRMAELDAMKLRWREKNRPAKRKPKPRGRDEMEEGPRPICLGPNRVTPEGKWPFYAIFPRATYQGWWRAKSKESQWPPRRRYHKLLNC